MDEQRLKELMGELGSRRSARKSDAARINIAKARAAIVRTLAPCTCGNTPHTYPCPVYQREYRARNKVAK